MIAIRKLSSVLPCCGLAAYVACAPAAAEDSPPSPWQFTAGVGAAEMPRYPGSSLHRYLALPILSASYGRFFAGAVPGSLAGGGIGLYVYQDAHWRVGASVSEDFITPRRASDDPRLHGLADIDRTAHASVFASYTLDWATLRSSVRSDIGGHGEGTLATLDLEGRYHLADRITLSAGPNVVWASGPYMQTFFGIDAAQSAASGLPQYATKSGVEALGVSAGATYELTSTWSISARANASRLHDVAAESPITESRNQDSTMLFATYRF